MSGSLPVSGLVPNQNGVVSNTITVTPGAVAAVDTLTRSIDVSSECPALPVEYRVGVVCAASDAGVPTVTWGVFSPAEADLATVTDDLGAFVGGAEVGPGVDTVSGSLPVSGLVPDQDGVVSNTITVTPGTATPVELDGSIDVSNECPPPVPVSPVNPEIHLATCANGEVTVPTVTAATGPTGVSYKVDPGGALTPGTVAHTVTVTATLADGYGWGTLGTGWLSGGSEASKTYTVILPAASCAVVTPVGPTWSMRCVVVGCCQAPTLTLPTTDGITYTVDPRLGRMRSCSTVTVTATLTSGGVAGESCRRGGRRRRIRRRRGRCSSASGRASRCRR